MTDNTFPATAVILVNYQGADDTLACLESLKRLDYPNLRIIVVDNASKDGSAEKIAQAHPEARLIEAPENRGFSAGNNLGIQDALMQPDMAYVWLLNNDTTVPPDALTRQMETALDNPKALIGAMILHPDGRFQRVGNRLNRWFGGLRGYSEPEAVSLAQVESLTGCSMLIPRSAFSEVGLLDEDYFLYFEDNDYCLRALKSGYACLVSHQAQVFHKEGATTGKNKPLVTYYYQRNRLLLLKRFASPVQFGVVQLYTLYRLFRSTIKTMLSADADRLAHHRAFQLAVRDFYRGVRGPCPHPL